MTKALKIVVREGLTVIALLGYMLYLNWRLCLVFLAVAPLIALVGFLGAVIVFVIVVLLAEAHEWAEALWLKEWRRAPRPRAAHDLRGIV